MRLPETVYRGERVYEGRKPASVRVTVDGRTLDPHRSLKVWCHSPDGFEWGYGGSGPAQLALALVLDATGDRELSERTYQYVKWATVATWHRDAWTITAGEIRKWVKQAEREQDLRDHPVIGCVAVRRCRVCGCTDFNCTQCVLATGRPCSWVEGEDPPLCTRCAEAEDAALVAEMEGGGA